MPDKKLNLSGAQEILSSKKTNLNLSGAEDILKKKDQPISSGFGIGSELSRPSEVPTPLIGKGLIDYQERERKAQQAAENLSNKLNTNLATYMAAQGEEPTKKMLGAQEQSAYNQLQAVIQKDLGNKGGRTGYLYNKLLQGTGATISGGIDAGLNLMKYAQPMSPLINEANILDYRYNIAPDVKNFLKDQIGAEVDKGAERKFDEDFITSAVGGLAYSVPAMVSPMGAGLYAQAYDSGLDLINSTEAGKDLTEGEKTLFASALGVIMGTLEKAGLDRYVGRSIAPQIARNTTFKAIKELAEKGVKITPDAIEGVAKREVNSIKNKLLNAGDQTYKAFLDEFTTGGLQELGTIGLEQSVNALKNKDIFDTQGMGEMFGRVLKSAAQEGVGGGIMGVAKGSLPISTSGYLVKEIANAKSFDDVNRLLRDVESIGIENNYAPEQIDDVVSAINDIFKLKETLPPQLTNAQQEGILNLIIERNQLSEDLQKANSDLQNIDPAFADNKKSEISIIEKQINSINNDIKNISEDENYAVQKQTTGQVPVQPEAQVGGEVAQGEPQAEPQAPAEGIQEEVKKLDSAIKDISLAPSVKFWEEPTFKDESDNYPQSSSPNSFSEFENSGTDFESNLFRQKDIVAYDENGDIVSVLSFQTEGPDAGAFKISTRDDAKRKGWATKVLNEAEARGLDIVGSINKNRFSESGRKSIKKWLESKKESLLKTSAKPKEKITIGVAPFREINVTSLDQDAELRSTPEYKNYVKNIVRISKGLGLKVNQSAETWGGYVDTETGRPVQEVSNMLQINATPEEARVLAAILGKTAPEMQDSVLVGSFNEKGSGAEHTIKTGGFENANKAIEFLKKNGLEYFTIDKNTGDIIILDLDGSAADNIINFNNDLNENGINTEHTAYGVEAEFVGRDDYDGILAEQGRKIAEERGIDIDAIVKSATERFQKTRKQKVEETTEAKAEPEPDAKESGIIKRPAGKLAKIRTGLAKLFKRGKTDVGPAIKPEEFAEFEEVVDNEQATRDLKDSIETPFRNKEKLEKTSKAWTSRFIKAAFDSQIEVIQRLLKQGGDVGKIVVATLKNRKGYNGKASIIFRSFNKEIFDKLGYTPNIDMIGRKVSERELFDTFLNLNRIINIDARISDKFARLVQVDRQLKDKSISKEKAKELSIEKENLVDYLEKRKALTIKDGQYAPKQYKHSGNRTAASARAELKLMQSANPELYKKLDKAYDSYTDAFRFLLEEQYKNNLISKEVYDELFSYNYIPTKFIQHFIEGELSQDNPALSSKLSSSIKNLTGGSDSDVITNFQAILELYTNSVYKRIYENRASNSLARAIFATGEQEKGLMKVNQLVKDADADITKKPMYNINLDMSVQEPIGEDKFGNPTYDDVPAGYDVIYFYRDNGKRERIVASKDFVDTWYDRGGLLSPKGEEYLSNTSKWSGVNLFKSLITKNNPAFGIYQILQDAPQALIATQAYPDFILGSAMLAKDYASVAGDIAKFIKDDELTPLFKEAVDAGIFSDFLSTESDILQSQSLVNSDGSTNYKTAAKVLKRKTTRAFDKTLDSIAKFNEAIEYATRLAVYKRMKQNLVAKYTKENGGVAPSSQQMFDIKALAAEQARGMVDFSRSGTIVKPLNKVLAYLNAGMQAFYSSAKALKNNPTKAAILLTEIGLGGVAVLAMSLGAWGDEKEKKKRLAEYMMLSKYQKSNYFNIYNPYSDDPEKRWIRWPKPQIFRGWINMLEQGYLSTVMNADIDENVIKEAFSNDLPIEPDPFDLVTRNPLVNGVVKYGLNKDIFRNQEVVRNAEKIEDWAEGVDDENVAKIYKKLGASTKGVYIPFIGTEGFSPKRTEAFVESLIGDPSRNTTTAILDKGGRSMFYLATGDIKAIEEEFAGDLGDNMLKLSGLKGRLFTKTPKLDNAFMDMLNEQEKELYTKRLLIRTDIEQIYDDASSPQQAKKMANERLNDLVKNGDIDVKYKKIVLDAQDKRSAVEGKPAWYKLLLYSTNNDQKVQILEHYAKYLSSDQWKEAGSYLLKKGIVSPEVTKEFARKRSKK